MSSYLMAGGGTGGHVIPALAVARELRRRGHQVFFVGTGRGIEARLAPAENFDLERIEIGGLKNVGAGRLIRTLWQLPLSIMRAGRIIDRRKPSAVFSMGGYAAGPPVLAALQRKLPVIVMEPNAVPGFTNRKIGRFVTRALISFPDTAIYFPNGRTEVTGLPVRQEFFAIPVKPRSARFSLLATGGSQGSRTLNEAARKSWTLFKNANFPIDFTLQTGRAQADELAREFSRSGLKGRVTAFIEDMPKAFAAADLVISRSGAGAVAELAAAGKPSVLVPFPHASDQHQLRNAEAFERAGAARLVRDSELTGEKIFAIAHELSADDGGLERMSAAARRFARPGAARRAAEILEEVSQSSNIR
jgi:UDP-N-acetylglucosamine--N-acetylmuramyl-(pentapeptide) pyrophosphoryl-undecaprenol N-acetylglucosamine transferase